jgi:hypothetical protein
MDSKLRKLANSELRDGEQLLWLLWNFKVREAEKQLLDAIDNCKKRTTETRMRKAA